ncbi:MAG: FAD binding domain-containing protein, partial [Pyrinomonadaceae bacterium]
MRAFEYASPTTKEQAVSLLGNTWADGEVLAGGTDLLSLMKDDIIAPKRLVNIKEIQDMGGISTAKSRGARSGSDLSIGALVTIQDLLDNVQVQSDFPAIAQAAEGITSPQIRNMGTVGGDLCQRPRCWYYRAGFGLLAKDQSGASLVTGGDNRYHAILGNTGSAYFVSPSGLAPALIAYNARLEVFGPKGAHEISVEKFFRLPQSESEREYDLKPNEIVTRIIVPKAPQARSATYEVRQKEALDWPLATASVSLIMNGDKVRSARIVMG